MYERVDEIKPSVEENQQIAEVTAKSISNWGMFEADSAECIAYQRGVADEQQRIIAILCALGNHDSFQTIIEKIVGGGND